MRYHTAFSEPSSLAAAHPHVRYVGLKPGLGLEASILGRLADFSWACIVTQTTRHFYLTSIRLMTPLLYCSRLLKVIYELKNSNSTGHRIIKVEKFGGSFSNFTKRTTETVIILSKLVWINKDTTHWFFKNLQFCCVWVFNFNKRVCSTMVLCIKSWITVTCWEFGECICFNRWNNFQLILITNTPYRQAAW